MTNMEEPRQLTAIEKSFVKGITTEYFSDKDLTKSQGQVTQKGWYWADKWDNARYGDWTGPFTTHQLAINAGIEYRTRQVYSNFQSV